MTSTRRREVLEAIRDSDGPLTLAAVADLLGVHANTVRFHVEHLLESGQLEQVDVEHHGTGRPPAHYRAARRMDPAGPRQYRMLAEILLAALPGGQDRSERALAAGRAWGRGLADATNDATSSPPETLVGLLDRVGFAPQRRTGGGVDQIALRHCPFLELAQDRSDVVCPVHLGLMQGALERWGSDVTATRLEPFVEPDLCLAHLGTTKGT